MKRFAAAALVAFVPAFLAFAESASPRLEFSGEFLTGARVEIDGDNGSTAEWFSEEYGVAGAGSAFFVDGSYDAGNYGASVRVILADGYASYAKSYPSNLIGHSYGWLKFFDGTLTVKAGSVGEGSFDTVGDQEISFFDRRGLVSTWSPIEGLIIGGAAGIEPALLTGGTPAALTAVRDALALGASFRNDAVTVEAALTSGDWHTEDDSYDTAAAYVQFAVTAIENLSIEADALFINVADFAAAGEISATELVGHTIGKVTPSLLCGQNLSLADIAAAELTFEPNVRYALSDYFAPYVGAEISIVGAELSYAGKIGVDASVSPDADVSAYYRLSPTGTDHLFQVDFAWRF